MGKKTVSGTREWATSSANCMTGCSNNCRYCYAKAAAIKLGKVTPESWADEKSMPSAKFNKRNGTVMFPTQHDITNGNYIQCKDILWDLLQAGNKVLVVSKPNIEIISKLCNSVTFAKDTDQILFRFTIGSMDPSTLAFWEPGAPTFAERFYALMWTFKNGWQTSVSMEPMLDIDHRDVIRLAKTVASYVTDSVWIGKANKLRQRCFTNAGGKLNPDTDREILALEASQNDAAIIRLHDRVMSDPILASKVKWKESIKKVVGINIPEEVGLDI